MSNQHAHYTYDSLKQAGQEERYLSVAANRSQIGMLASALGSLASTLRRFLRFSGFYLVSALFSSISTLAMLLLKEPVVTEAQAARSSHSLWELPDQFAQLVRDSAAALHGCPLAAKLIAADAFISVPCYLTKMFLQQRLVELGWPTEWLFLPLLLGGAACVAGTEIGRRDDADGDTLTVVEELNDETIRTINNAPKGEELTVTITSEKLYALGLNSVNTLKITVTDGKGGTAYRRVTFKRTNSAPTISGQDKALGLKNGSFAENYTVSDVEGDNVVVTEFVDDVQIRSYQATLGQQETIELTREKWLSLTNGQHQLRIEAVDGNFATSVRVFSFSKKETVIKFELVAPEETDAAATKVLVTPTWKIEGAVAKVEACNNGFDAVPTWEDITAMVQINRVYNFTNKTKTASKWGVNIRFTITKNEGFEGEVSISGFGGAYE